jgi:hypothetical protein
MWKYLSRKRAYLSNLPETFNTFHSACYRPQNRYLENPPGRFLKIDPSHLLQLRTKQKLLLATSVANSYHEPICDRKLLTSWHKVVSKISHQIWHKASLNCHKTLNQNLTQDLSQNLEQNWTKLLTNFAPKLDTKLLTFIHTWLNPCYAHSWVCGGWGFDKKRWS